MGNLAMVSASAALFPTHPQGKRAALWIMKGIRKVV